MKLRQGLDGAGKIRWASIYTVFNIIYIMRI